ncbi:hypothetical protein DRQ36_06960 [bacterium]|nr:MAG: hypothetical protein DRQ36_06960 [bacterium]
MKFPKSIEDSYKEWLLKVINGIRKNYWSAEIEPDEGLIKNTYEYEVFSLLSLLAKKDYKQAEKKLKEIEDGFDIKGNGILGKIKKHIDEENRILKNPEEITEGKPIHVLMHWSSLLGSEKETPLGKEIELTPFFHQLDLIKENEYNTTWFGYIGRTNQFTRALGEKHLRLLQDQIKDGKTTYLFMYSPYLSPIERLPQLHVGKIVKVGDTNDMDEFFKKPNTALYYKDYKEETQVRYAFELEDVRHIEENELYNLRWFEPRFRRGKRYDPIPKVPYPVLVYEETEKHWFEKGNEPPEPFKKWANADTGGKTLDEFHNYLINISETKRGRFTPIPILVDNFISTSLENNLTSFNGIDKYIEILKYILTIFEDDIAFANFLLYGIYFILRSGETNKGQKILKILKDKDVKENLRYSVTRSPKTKDLVREILEKGKDLKSSTHNEELKGMLNILISYSRDYLSDEWPSVSSAGREEEEQEEYEPTIIKVDSIEISNNVKGHFKDSIEELCDICRRIGDKRSIKGFMHPLKDEVARKLDKPEHGNQWYRIELKDNKEKCIHVDIDRNNNKVKVYLVRIGDRHKKK